jgi:hypothetical protein
VEPDRTVPRIGRALVGCPPGSPEVVSQLVVLGDDTVLAFERPLLTAHRLGELPFEAVDTSEQLRLTLLVDLFESLSLLDRVPEMLLELGGLGLPSVGSALSRPRSRMGLGSSLVEVALARRVIGVDARTASSLLRFVRDLTYREERFVLDAFLHGYLLVLHFVRDETE